MSSLLLHDTLSGNRKEFKSIKQGIALLYHCGPTVYDYAHIGNLKKYINDDVLRRTLEAEGYTVKQVINITDIGHLTSDADEGDDKMVSAIRREGLPMEMASLKTVAQKYTAAFEDDIKALNIRRPTAMPRASEYVPQQIALIEQLFAKGLAYDTLHTVYFDVAKFPSYGKLGHIDLVGQQAGARIVADPEKRGPHDFALWKKNPAMGFESPWGVGFPGWHIECSAMVMSILGETIDIHTGGIDHIAVHHNNEIAQSEGVTGHTFANYWLHSEFITIDETKMSKSKGNFLTLKTLTDAGFHPLTYRYWVLNGHYRSAMNFSFDALMGAHNGLARLHSIVAALDTTDVVPHPEYDGLMRSAMHNDLNTSGVLAALWSALNDETLTAAQKKSVILFADTYLGIGLTEALAGHSPLVPQAISINEVPLKIQTLVQERESLRALKRFSEADLLRSEIEAAGYVLKDTGSGSILFVIHTPHPPNSL